MNDDTEFVLFMLNVIDGYMAQTGHEWWHRVRAFCAECNRRVYGTDRS